MPYSNSNIPDRIKKLPDKAKEIWISAFNSAYKQYNKDEEKANATAWANVKNKFKQTAQGRWIAKSLLEKVAAICPGSKIRSKGKGQGLGRGKGKGPMGKPINKTKSEPFRLYFSMQKTFNKDMKDVVKELEIGDEIPEFLQDMELESGVYSWGRASTPKVDSDGEKVIIPDEVIEAMTNSAYNKIFHSHDHQDISTGTLKFLGRVPQLKDELILVERMNEYHPAFKNYAGSIKNGNITHYSVGGDATISYDPSDGSRVRTVKRLNEISRTSYPGNDDANISGMFFVKSKQGGYAYKTNGVNEMEIEEIMKKLEELEKSFSERLEGLEKFKKDLEDSKLDDNDDAEPEKTASDTGEESEPTEPVEEVKKPAEDADKVEKMLNEKIEKIVDSKLATKIEKSKAVTKVEPIAKTKKDDNEILSFLQDSNRKSLVGGK